MGTASTDFVSVPTRPCADDLPSHRWGNCMLAATFPACQDRLPVIRPTAEGVYHQAIYLDPEKNRFGFTASGNRPLGFINPRAYDRARECLARYGTDAASATSSAGFYGRTTVPKQLRNVATAVLQIADLAVMLAVVIPGGTIVTGAKHFLPHLAAEAATFLGRHTMVRGALAVTQAPGWLKAATVVGAHAVRDPETLIPDFGSVAQDWYGDGKAWVTAPLTAAILWGGAYLSRLPGGPLILETVFSVGTGLHHAERASLSRQKDALLPTAAAKRALLDQELRKNSAVSMVILGFSGGAALLHGIDFGKILCLVDDLIPPIARGLDAASSRPHSIL